MGNVMEVHGLTKVFHRPERKSWSWPWQLGSRKRQSASRGNDAAMWGSNVADDDRHGVNREVAGKGTLTTDKVALHPIDFEIARGDSVAFIGPNGAGKSTTIKILTGILHPSGGDARVLGMRPWEKRVDLSYRIGTVFGQKSQLWYHLPPRDTFTLMGRIYNLSGADFVRRRDELVERFNLGPFMDTPVRKLSLGERMRCEIALSFLHRPEILFLDEPTIGLDVVVKQNIRELIRNLNRNEGVTVFLTSHDATDVESLCERVLVINHGRLLFAGPTPQMVQRFLHFKEVHFEVSDGPIEFSADGVTVKYSDDRNLRLVVDIRKTPIERVLSHALQRHQVRDVRILEPSMEEVIRAIYTEQATVLG